jgi:hypothetical protein
VGRSSNRLFDHPLLTHALSIAAHGSKIKTGYVKEVREAIETLKNQE